jgi:hypothetical protein
MKRMSRRGGKAKAKMSSPFSNAIMKGGMKKTRKGKRR